MSGNVRNHIFEHVHPLKIQIRLRTHTVWSDSSMGQFWIAKEEVHIDNHDTD